MRITSQKWIKRRKHALSGTFGGSRAQRWVRLFFGLMLAGLGIGLQHEALLGTSPMSTLCNGFARQVGVENGQAQIIWNLILVLPCLIWNRERLGWGTLCCIVFIGSFCDLSVFAFHLHRMNQWRLSVRFLFSLIGIIVQAAGLSLYVSTNMGLGGVEGFASLVQKKTGWCWRKAKTLVDGVLLFVGIAFGGAYGVGTVCATALNGTLMQYFLKRLGHGQNRRKRTSS
ncbi:MAG: YitT family protein [Ndongobacter sp.]|nr:YitT family protein [Ndongobacter sp.]